MNTSNIIIDASIIIKWLLPDEEDVQALRIKQDFNKNRLTITIPHLTYYEIGNVLKTAVKRERIKEDIATKLYSSFIDLEFVAYAMSDLFTLALYKSIDFNISYYDASYIALSEYLQIPFITADQKLLKRISDKLIVDIQDYTSIF